MRYLFLYRNSPRSLTRNKVLGEVNDLGNIDEYKSAPNNLIGSICHEAEPTPEKGKPTMTHKTYKSLAAPTMVWFPPTQHGLSLSAPLPPLPFYLFLPIFCASRPL